ncbi:MAG TPA: YihY/virulence factor BrkB family protein [Longimicrobiales bacterium]|nr:YihY/virulence factor BrkB family protein [Longimicrobiales bacterium]
MRGSTAHEREAGAPAARESEHAIRPPYFLTRFADRARGEIRLTMLAMWRGSIGIYNSHDLTFASSIAYYSLLSLFPFFLLLLSIIANVTSSDADREAVLSFMLSYFPRQVDFVRAQLQLMQGSRLELGLAGSLLMLWAAMGVFGAITSAVNHAWGVERQPSYFKHKMISLVMLVMASLLLLAVLALMSAIDIVETHFVSGIVAVVPELRVLQTFAARSAGTAGFIVVVGLIFYFVPNAKVRFRDVWVGAVLTGLLWRAAFAGFSWYVRDISRLAAIHGSIATVIVFLFWIYISAVIFLYGVEVTAANARLRRHRPEEIPAAPAPRI